MSDATPSPPSLSLGYVVVFVPDVEQAVAFYENAFGLMAQMATKAFAQLETGTVSLAFASEANERSELPEGFIFAGNRPASPPAGIQISFLSGDVQRSFDHAVAAGCTPVVPPAVQPWGQTISRVRDLNGVLVSIVSPVHIA